MEFLKYLLILSLVSLVPGQLLRLPIFSFAGAITFSDIAVLVLDVYFIFYFLLFKKTIKFSKVTLFPVLAFSLWALATDIFANLSLNLNQVLISSLFLVRFVSYFFISQVVLNSVSKNKAKSWLHVLFTVGIIFAFLGFLQLIFVPDLSFLAPLGWDPHQRRIVSTLLDPNFTGFVFSVLFSFAACFSLFEKNPQKRLLYNIYSLIFLSALLFTFSRSAYLSFLAVIFIIGIFKSPKLLLLLTGFSILLFVFVTPIKTRVIGALTLDETAQARIESWQNALTIFQDSPIVGVGFNTYRFAQEKHDFFTMDNPYGGHSGSGSDSSLLLVLATTGLVGLGLFLFLIIRILKYLLKNASKNPFKLASLAVFVSLLVNSQFVNSIFFPQIMLILWIIFGLTESYDS